MSGTVYPHPSSNPLSRCRYGIGIEAFDMLLPPSSRARNTTVLRWAILLKTRDRPETLAIPLCFRTILGSDFYSIFARISQVRNG